MHNKKDEAGLGERGFVKKKSHGIYDRFPPGAAWYDSVHEVGQLGLARNTQNETTFFSSAQVTTMSQSKNKASINPSQFMRQRQLR